MSRFEMDVGDYEAIARRQHEMKLEIERLRLELSYRIHDEEDILAQNAEIERLRAAIEDLLEDIPGHYRSAVRARAALGQKEAGNEHLSPTNKAT